MEKVLTRMPESLKQILKIAAEQKGISLNAQMLSILWEWANEQIIRAIANRTEDKPEEKE